MKKDRAGGDRVAAIARTWNITVEDCTTWACNGYRHNSKRLPQLVPEVCRLLHICGRLVSSNRGRRSKPTSPLANCWLIPYNICVRMLRIGQHQEEHMNLELNYCSAIILAKHSIHGNHLHVERAFALDHGYEGPFKKSHRTVVHGYFYLWSNLGAIWIMARANTGRLQLSP